MLVFTVDLSGKKPGRQERRVEVRKGKTTDKNNNKTISSCNIKEEKLYASLMNILTLTLPTDD